MPKLARSAFVSYARADARLVDRFLALMRPRLATLRELDVDAWTDRRIPAGSPWREEIAAAIDASDVGLLCVSYAFLASEYVTQVELPALLERKTVVPVAVEPVDVARADLHGLADLQIFRHRPNGSPAARAFSECGGANAGAFCTALVDEIASRLLGGARR